MASVADVRRIPDDVRASLLPRREQAAAVCYRTGKRGMEFLLVRTRSGRWTFPKGSLVPGMTYAQSAALEAFEEAGVHGRIEQTAFARYKRRDSAKAVQSTIVRAFLCEVMRLSKPQERKRHRTWFSAEKAKHCLHERRTPEFGAELIAVVDRAVARVCRLHSGPEGEKEAARLRTDTLLRVTLEAPYAASPRENRRIPSLDAFSRRVRRSAMIDIAAGDQLRRFLPGTAQQLARNLLRLGTGNKPPPGMTSKVSVGEGGPS
jgi:8-oxo-dGTP pyrophosphatase MutT (NUDIX family)